jgi:predicted metal-binding membrane protein
MANNLLEKLVLLLSVLHAFARHAITVTNQCFTWCSVYINMMFTAVSPLFIVSERSAKKKDKCGKPMDAEKLLISNYLGKIV